MRRSDLLKENRFIPLQPSRRSNNDPARKMFHKAISHVLHEILDEDSSISSTVRNSPYADLLIQHVHSELSIPDNVQWKPETKITWKDIKERSPNYVLIAGSRGTAAIKWDGSEWRAMVATGNGIRKLRSSSINALVGDMKEDLGKVMGYWSSVGTGGYGRSSRGEVEKKRDERERARRIDNPTMLDPTASMSTNLEAIYNKLRPLFLKYVDQAIADVKGVSGIALKNDAYNKVEIKLQILKKLSDIRERLIDDPASVPAELKSRLRPALYMTASHYYPDDTGNFTLGSGYRSNSPDRSEGMKKVVADIANGDQNKLVTLMNYLKHVLLHL
jgi:hypothetical protein